MLWTEQAQQNARGLTAGRSQWMLLLCLDFLICYFHRRGSETRDAIDWSELDTFCASSICSSAAPLHLSAHASEPKERGRRHGGWSNLARQSAMDRIDPLRLQYSPCLRTKLRTSRSKKFQTRKEGWPSADNGGPARATSQHRGAEKRGVWVVLGKGLPSQSPMARQTQTLQSQTRSSGTRRGGVGGAHVAATHESFDDFVKLLIVCQTEKDTLDSMIPAAMLRFLPVPSHRKAQAPMKLCMRLCWTFAVISKGHANAIHRTDDVTGLVSTGQAGAGNKRSHPLELQVGLRDDEVW